MSLCRVKIDVEQLLADREYEKMYPPSPTRSKPKKKPAPIKQEAVAVPVPAASGKKKRKRQNQASGASPAKKIKSAPPPVASSSTKKVTLKLPPPPESYPCCLCISMNRAGMLRVRNPPPNMVTDPGEVWMAHEECARIVPETWVDEEDGVKMVFGVDAVVKDRWNLVSSFF